MYPILTTTSSVATHGHNCLVKYNEYIKYSYILVRFVLVVFWPNKRQIVAQKEETSIPSARRAVLSASPPSPLAGDRRSRESRRRPVATGDVRFPFRPGDVAGIERRSRSGLHPGVPPSRTPARRSRGAVRGLAAGALLPAPRRPDTSHVCTRFRPASLTQCCFLITSSKSMYLILLVLLLVTSSRKYPSSSYQKRQKKQRIDELII